MKAVVTGGAGFIGSHLVESLLADGRFDVAVIDDFSTGSEDNLPTAAVDVVAGDVCDPAVAALAADADVVFHLAVRNVRASITDPVPNFRVNAQGTLAVVDAMRTGKQGRFVYVSSSEVYGTAVGFTEGDVPQPTTVYGAGKLAGEHITLAYHRTYGMDTRVVRPFNSYGPRSHFEGDSGEVIPKFILRAMAGRPLLVHGDGSQTRDFMFVADTAHWIRQLAGLDALAGDVVNVGSGVETSIIDLAHAVIAMTGSQSDIVHADPRPGDLPRLLADTAKLRSMCDFAPDTSLEAGLEATARYFAAKDLEAMLAQEVDLTWT